MVYDEPLKLNELRDDLHLLPRAVRQARRAGLPGREAAQARAQHDLRRRPRRSCSASTWRRWSKALRKQFGQEGEGRRAQQARRSQAGYDFAEENLPKQDPFRVERDERDRGQDHHRRQRRRRARLHVGRRHRRHLVPDHALVVALRVADRLPEEVPHRPGDRARPPSPSCRPRTSSPPSAWCIGAGWAGARSMTATSGPGISLMSEFTGPRLLRRDARGHLRRAARRALHGPADAHHAGRHPVDRGPLARRHQAPPAASRPRPEECYAHGDGGLRPRRAVPDAGLRHDRPRPRHEQLDVRPVPVSRRADRSRQGARPPRSSKQLGELGPLQGRGRRRHPVPHAARRRHAPRYFTRGSGHNEKAQYSERADDYVEQHGPPRAEVRDGAALRAAARGRRDRPGPTSASSPTARRTGRSTRAATSCASEHGLETALPAPAGVSVHRRGAATSSTRHDRVYVVEQNRDAQMLSLLQLELDAERSRQAAQRPALRRPADRRAHVTDESGTRNVDAQAGTQR